MIDLLSDDLYSKLLRRPSLLAELLPAECTLVAINEIKKIPALLDEVHQLIEMRGITFLLSGSSARKVRRGGANLLGGRAWEAALFPLTSDELGDSFELETYLNNGGLPAIYFSEYAQELRAYLRYSGCDAELCYWRSTSQKEVDMALRFYLGGLFSRSFGGSCWNFNSRASAR